MTAAFAPGRANLIGEHTDYNQGLALPFAIERGITARVAQGSGGEQAAGPYVRGVLSELGLPADTRVEIESDLPSGGGLSSSAALTLAVAIALRPPPADPRELATLAQRVEREWAGADTGLLDQLAILLGRAGHAVRIDFRDLSWRHVPLDLGDWHAGDPRLGRAARARGLGLQRAARRVQGRRARRWGSSRCATRTRPRAEALPAPLGARVRHVIGENARVDAAVDALERGDLAALGDLLDASHRSLRDLYEVSVPEVEATVERAKAAGAAGARIMGGGFGGVVLALFPPGAQAPPDALSVRPAAGARVIQA